MGVGCWEEGFLRELTSTTFLGNVTSDVAMVAADGWLYLALKWKGERQRWHLPVRSNLKAGAAVGGAVMEVVGGGVGTGPGTQHGGGQDSRQHAAPIAFASASGIPPILNLKHFDTSMLHHYFIS